MKYDGDDFKRDFLRRTLTLIKEYEGPYDATFLVNCLLGLLVVPKEAWYEDIPKEDFNSLSDWGIRPDSITPGKCKYGYEHQPNLRQLVTKLRNAVAHFDVEPIIKGNEVGGFLFKDWDGFCAALSLGEIEAFVHHLASHLGEERRQTNE